MYNTDTNKELQMSDFELPTRKVKSSNTSGTTQSISSKELEKIDDQLSTEKDTKLEDKETPKYSKEELLRVFDEIIFSGEYREDYVIRNRLQITFKTRTAEDINFIQKTIDSAGLNLISSVETMRSIMNLQFSLASYDKKDLSNMKPDERMKLIERLPGPIVGILIDRMAKFDEKVMLACKEGEENF